MPQQQQRPLTGPQHPFLSTPEPAANSPCRDPDTDTSYAAHVTLQLATTHSPAAGCRRTRHRSLAVARAHSCREQGSLNPAEAQNEGPEVKPVRSLIATLSWGWLASDLGPKSGSLADWHHTRTAGFVTDQGAPAVGLLEAVVVVEPEPRRVYICQLYSDSST